MFFKNAKTAQHLFRKNIFNVNINITISININTNICNNNFNININIIIIIITYIQRPRALPVGLGAGLFHILYTILYDTILEYSMTQFDIIY